MISHKCAKAAAVATGEPCTTVKCQKQDVAEPVETSIKAVLVSTSLAGSWFNVPHTVTHEGAGGNWLLLSLFGTHIIAFSQKAGPWVAHFQTTGPPSKQWKWKCCTSLFPYVDRVFIGAS